MWSGYPTSPRLNNARTGATVERLNPSQRRERLAAGLSSSAAGGDFLCAVERLNPSQRREYSLSADCEQMSDIWQIAAELETKAKSSFPPDWMAEIRITQGTSRFPRGYHIRCYSSYTLGGTPFQMLILSPATSRSDLGCWVIRAFKVVRP